MNCKLHIQNVLKQRLSNIPMSAKAQGFYYVMHSDTIFSYFKKGVTCKEVLLYRKVMMTTTIVRMTMMMMMMP